MTTNMASAATMAMGEFSAMKWLSTLGLWRSVENVAPSTQGDEMRRCVWSRLEETSKTNNEVVDGPVGGERVHPPHFF